MKLGICGGEKQFAAAAKNGFCYMDVPLTGVRDLSGDALRAMRDKALDMGLTIDCFVCFFGSEVTLYGGESARDFALDYATRNFETVRLLGGSVCCIGSGGARSVPEGMDRRQAEEELVELLQRLADRAADYGISLAVEPLRPAETNMINTVADGIRIKRAADRKNLGCLVDFFHAYSNGEELSALDALRPGELIHVHLARPNPDRGAPREEDIPALTAWRDKLREIGYDGRVTVECRWPSDFDAAVAETAKVMQLFK